MARLLVHVEGETEETFVNEVLAPHLRATGWQVVSARLLGNARLREKRGGIKSWASVKKEIMRHLNQDPRCHATTMVDYYGLPPSWPGRARADQLPVARKGLHVEEELHADLQAAMGAGFQATRFIPFLVMHEFEALLFSDCDAFSRGMGRPDLQGDLQSVRAGFNGPEEINDSPVTAPSKRVQSLFPGYQKILHGNLAALELGLSGIRRECPHFARWLERLEQAAFSQAH